MFDSAIAFSAYIGTGSRDGCYDLKKYFRQKNSAKKLAFLTKKA
jgi:hypothetical protein